MIESSCLKCSVGGFLAFEVVIEARRVSEQSRNLDTEALKLQEER